MTTNTDMQRMTSIAPLINQFQDIAREEVPAPRTCLVRLWDDDDYDIIIYHNHGPDEREGIWYDVETGEVVWKYRKGSEWGEDETAPSGPGYGTAYVQAYEESDERVITTIHLPD